MSENILEVKNLCKYFEINRGIFAPKQILKAVDNVSFNVKKGETFGLVGESGCGKTTLGRTIVRLYKPTSGSIQFKGDEIATIKSEKEFLKYRKELQMVFQDPYASLNPRMTVGEIIGEPMDIHKLYTPSERKDRVVELLKTVGLNPDHISRFPHEFSGGQRQRIGIARTLALDPEFIICDEPISALDVSIQAQIINLLEELRDERGLSYIFIAHDISMVKHISQSIAVMYLGNIVESGNCNEIYHNPQHPYTKALLSAVPIPDPDVAKSRQRIHLEGEIPSPLNPPSGCPFRTRCPYAQKICAEVKPELREIDGRKIACHVVK